MVAKIYLDARGWQYKVMPGLGKGAYKGRYKKPERSGWHCMANMPWRTTVEEAQADLDEMARRKKWRVIEDE